MYIELISNIVKSILNFFSVFEEVCAHEVTEQKWRRTHMLAYIDGF